MLIMARVGKTRLFTLSMLLSCILFAYYFV